MGHRLFRLQLRNAQNRWRIGSPLPVLALLFFCSGACGLIYQVLWLRLLGLTFGVTVYAASTVWASFMAGLALGSLAGGWLGDRVRRPLLWFGAAEILVGLSALASPRALDALQRLLRSRPTRRSTDSLATTTLARAVISFAVLIVPDAPDGRDAADRRPLGARAGARISAAAIGLLYGTNTAGAIAGTAAGRPVLHPGSRHQPDVPGRPRPSTSSWVSARRRCRCLSADARGPAVGPASGTQAAEDGDPDATPGRAVAGPGRVRAVGLCVARARGDLVPRDRARGAAHRLHVRDDSCERAVRHRARQLPGDALHAAPLALGGRARGRRDSR